MSDLAELLARVEAAKGPSRLLDAKITVALNIRPEWVRRAYPAEPLWIDHRDPRFEPVIRIHTTGKRRSVGHPPLEEYAAYTASLDAALALAERVRPGACVLMQITPARTLVNLHTRPLGLIGNWQPLASAKTAPLALLAALLKSLIAETANAV